MIFSGSFQRKCGYSAGESEKAYQVYYRVNNACIVRIKAKEDYDAIHREETFVLRFFLTPYTYFSYTFI